MNLESLPRPRPSLIALGVSLAFSVAATNALGLALATGRTNLNNDTAAGATSIAPTACYQGTGQDVLDFRGDGLGNATGLHSYACGFGNYEFGTRSSGERTFFADGTAHVDTTINGDSFSFVVNAGQIGAFGSTAFAGSEYQYAELTIFLRIDTTTYIDETWTTRVDAGGVAVGTRTSNSGLFLADSLAGGGNLGFVSYGLPGGAFTIDNLGNGPHSVVYEMTSRASGMVTSTSLCRGAIYNPPVDGGEGGGEGGPVDTIAEVPGGDFNEFAAFCGAGAQSGDPFPDTPFPDGGPIVRAIPEPDGTALLGLGAAMLALARIKRRRERKA